MRLFSYQTHDDIRVAACLDDAAVDVNRACAAMFMSAGHLRADAMAEAYVPAHMIDLLACGDQGIAAVKEVLAFVKRTKKRRREELLEDGILLKCEDAAPTAPVPFPGKVLCLGLNYRDHAEESGIPIPDEPVIFAKMASSVIGPNEPIVLGRSTKKVDYEVELAVIMGRECKNVKRKAAMDCVAGYTVLNDVSARDYQIERGGGQWVVGKSFDTFCPMGPWLVTKDDVKNPHGLDIKLKLNGRVMQHSNTKHLIFDIPTIIAYLSKVMTLEPGDVISTGTPGGVGFVRKPPRFLKPGDVCRLEVEKVGVLVNPVVRD